MFNTETANLVFERLTPGEAVNYTFSNGASGAFDLSSGTSVNFSAGAHISSGTPTINYANQIRSQDGASSGNLNIDASGVTTYGPSATRPTGAGTYTATVALAADSNFDAVSSSATAFTIANGDLYQAWAGAAAFDSDTNNDGVDNGLAWLLGAGNPSTNAVNMLPTFDSTSDPDYSIFTYRRSDAANTSPNTTIAVHYGSGLSGWSTAVPGPEIIIIPTDDFYGASPGVDKVEVKIKRALAVDNKLFTRLKIEVAP